MATYPVFSVGEVLTADDMNAVGLWKVTPTVSSSGGTAATVSNGVVLLGNGNTSVTVTCFSADFENYRLVFNGGDFSASGQFIRMAMSSVTNNHFSSLFYDSYTGLDTGYARSDDAAYWSVCVTGAADNTGFSIDVHAPFSSTDRTTIAGNYSGSGFQGWVGGTVGSTTSSSGFTLTLSSGSAVAGSLRVYGYRD